MRALRVGAPLGARADRAGPRCEAGPAGLCEAFVKRQKNDVNDGAAIHEMLSRPGLRFVKVRSVASQVVLSSTRRARSWLPSAPSFSTAL